MRRTVLAGVSTIIGLVMLLSFKTHGSRPGHLVVLGRGAGTSATAPGGLVPSGPTLSSGAARTVVGEAVDTPYGPVQLQVHLIGSQIVSIEPVQLPSGRQRDDEINSYAIPILDQEALQAQSARIDTVSGATYTSGGYAQSLQSALDQAHQ